MAKWLIWNQTVQSISNFDSDLNTILVILNSIPEKRLLPYVQMIIIRPLFRVYLRFCDFARFLEVAKLWRVRVQWLGFKIFEYQNFEISNVYHYGNFSDVMLAFFNIVKLWCWKVWNTMLNCSGLINSFTAVFK